MGDDRGEAYLQKLLSKTAMHFKLLPNGADIYSTAPPAVNNDHSLNAIPGI